MHPVPWLHQKVTVKMKRRSPAMKQRDERAPGGQKERNGQTARDEPKSTDPVPQEGKHYDVVCDPQGPKRPHLNVQHNKK